MRFILTIVIFAGLFLNADEKILRQIPKEYNVLSSANCKEIFEKDLTYFIDMIKDMDREDLLEHFEKNGLEPKILKNIWFSCRVDSNAVNDMADFRWLTFIEFTEDVKVEDIVKVLREALKIKVIEGKIAEYTSYEVNNKIRDIFIIQPNPRKIMLGSKDSLTDSLKLSKMKKEENLQHSLLGDVAIADLLETVKDHQIKVVGYTLNPQNFAKIKDLVFGMNIDKKMEIKTIINFLDKEHCDQVYTFVNMFKEGGFSIGGMQTTKKNFQDTKFDKSILLKIIFSEEELKQVGMLPDKKKENSEVKKKKEGAPEE